MRPPTQVRELQMRIAKAVRENDRVAPGRGRLVKGLSCVMGNYHAQLCVQLRLVCSAGVSPARVKIRSPVAWMAGMRETDYLKPIDKAILRGCERVTGP